MSKKLLGIIALLLTASLIAACGSGDANNGSGSKIVEIGTTTKATQQTTKETTTQKETETTAIVREGELNLLTGEYDLPKSAVGKRPVGVSVNNEYAAMPQYGVSDADIIYEMVKEVGCTRFLAVYSDYQNLPDVCAIRSYRYYFAPLICGLDAIYVHWGEDQTMMDYYWSLNMTTYDAMYGYDRIFGRDQDRISRGYGLEHASVFYGTNFKEQAEGDGVRLDLDEQHAGKTVFNFAAPEETITPDGEEVDELTIYFGSQNSYFEYNESTGTYYQTINSFPQTDDHTGIQLNYRNLFILETQVGMRDDGMHRYVDWQGENYDGWYVSNGRAQRIKWTKEDEYSPIEIFDLNGKELTVNAGKSYVTMVNPDMHTLG